jgi:hypothetical protein
MSGQATQSQDTSRPPGARGRALTARVQRSHTLSERSFSARKTIARDLVKHGLTVLIGSRNFERGEAAARGIGPDARAIQLDVTDRLQPRRAAAASRAAPYGASPEQLVAQRQCTHCCMVEVKMERPQFLGWPWGWGGGPSLRQKVSASTGIVRRAQVVGACPHPGRWNSTVLGVDKARTTRATKRHPWICDIARTKGPGARRR